MVQPPRQYFNEDKGLLILLRGKSEIGLRIGGNKSIHFANYRTIRDEKYLVNNLATYFLAKT